MCECARARARVRVCEYGCKWVYVKGYVCVHECACVRRAFVQVRMRACAGLCVCVCVRVRACGWVGGWEGA